MLELKQERKRINDVISPTNGLFSHMEYDFEFVNSSQLDTLFFISQGERAVAPLINFYIRDGTIPESSLTEISSTILSYYKDKWDRLKKLLKIEYDPIHNFSDEITESISDSTEETDSKTVTATKTGNSTNQRTNDTTDTTTNNLEETLTNDLTKTETNNLKTTDTKNLKNTTQGTVENQIQGFNSTSYVNSDKDVQSGTQSETGTDTVDKTGTVSTTDSGTSTKANTGTSALKKTGTIVDLLTNNLTDETTLSNATNNSHTRQRTMSRIGNIGNITTQQMLNQEIELWKWNFINQVLEDVKQLTTLQIYI